MIAWKGGGRGGEGERGSRQEVLILSNIPPPWTQKGRRGIFPPGHGMKHQVLMGLKHPRLGFLPETKEEQVPLHFASRSVKQNCQLWGRGLGSQMCSNGQSPPKAWAEGQHHSTHFPRGPGPPTRPTKMLILKLTVPESLVLLLHSPGHLRVGMTSAHQAGIRGLIFKEKSRGLQSS